MIVQFRTLLTEIIYDLVIQSCSICGVLVDGCIRTYTDSNFVGCKLCNLVGSNVVAIYTQIFRTLLLQAKNS